MQIADIPTGNQVESVHVSKLQERVPTMNVFPYSAEFLATTDLGPTPSHTRAANETFRGSHDPVLPRAPLKSAEAVHDFRNIIHSINMLSECALRDLQNSATVSMVVKQIQAACADANQLCIRMLDQSPGTAAKGESVDLSTLVVDLTPQLTTFLPDASALHLIVAGRSPLAVTSVSGIRQVILNLVKNAAEALGDTPGSVTVKTGLTKVDRMLTDESSFLGTAAPGQYSYLAVSDTGCGMDEETKSRLFATSFTTQASGHGLGTSSIWRIVQENGGAIQVHSAPGNGTQIRVLFPLSDVEVAADPAARPSVLSFQKYCDRIAEDQQLQSFCSKTVIAEERRNC
jgi:two-component sensor histidine kinase